MPPSDSIRIPPPEEKRRLYAEAFERVTRAVDGERDAVARMATTVAVLHGMMPHFYWTGFYRVVGGELVVGPYQGTPACQRIALGRGVCGKAWESGETQIVADVSRFPGHIACDARSTSEIVIPVPGPLGEIAGILDIDSSLPSAFSEIDQNGLEQIIHSIFG